ncbi:MAG: hypothetical protein FWF98_05065 [Dehalococcoidia bacterium]|nr:hypothetical protein [Dehalococcoidia bacterium]
MSYLKNAALKALKLQLAAWLALPLVLALGPISCSGGGDRESIEPAPKPKPTQLVMSNPSYSDNTKLVTWDAVPNVSAYEVILKQGDSIVRGLTTNSTEYKITENQSGVYTASLTAIGDGVNYLTSTPKSTSFFYTKIQEIIKLVMSQPSYNDNTKLVTWPSVQNATSYNVSLIQNGNIIRNVTVNGTQYEIKENQSGTFTVSIIANGNGTTHSNSDPRTTTANYTKQQEQNTDTYHQYYALASSLNSALYGVQGQTLTEQQQKQASDRVKEAFATGFAHDQYSKNLPFSSADIRKAFAFAQYKFPAGYDSFYDNLGNITVATTRSMNEMIRSTLHETGHFFGLGESLTELMSAKYMDYDISVTGERALLNHLQYTPFYDNLLREKVGDEKFWQTVFKSQNPNRDYGIMWNDNMTVSVDNQKHILVDFGDMQKARSLSAMAHGRSWQSDWNRVVTEFERFIGVTNVMHKFVEIAPVFENAFKNNNQSAIKKIQDFFGAVKSFAETNSYVWEESAIFDQVVHRFFNPMPFNVNLQQTTKVTRDGTHKWRVLQKGL